MTRSVGAIWEQAAQSALERAGLRLIARNWHCRYGELDLVMRDGEELVFVEVRYRDAAASADGTQSISPAKRRRLVRAADMFLAAHPVYAHSPCRFDSVAFSGSVDNAHCDWERAAFDAH